MKGRGGNLARRTSLSKGIKGVGKEGRWREKAREREKGPWDAKRGDENRGRSRDGRFDFAGENSPDWRDSNDKTAR